MRMFTRTCQECDYKLRSTTEPNAETKARAQYGFRKCPKCKSEAFDWGSWQDDSETADYTAD